LNQLTEQVIDLEPHEVRELSRKSESRLIELEKNFNAKVVLRGNSLKIIGGEEDVKLAFGLINEILDIQRQGGDLSEQQFKQILRQAQKRAATAENEQQPQGYDKPLSEIFLDGISLPLKRRRLSPITPGQKRYIEAIRRKDIVFGIGPAGTGKTYLAVAMAVSNLMAGKVSRIILCRPAVEAGERLGFLPGDLRDKLDPYVRPLYDALYEMMEAEKIHQALETGVIEIAPLAFMRGRTLNNAFVILDEAQNTTPEQMKMFLTRLGFESKAVITGDVTQIDLPHRSTSGLIHVQKVLRDIDDIDFTFFTKDDVVRHELVMKIVRAYEKLDKKEADLFEDAERS
jgi:phosphate starvation-inducible protein PhoH and related proteins